MNPDLRNKIMLGLFGASGPLANWLATKYHMDNPTIDMVLNICMVLTPLIYGAAVTMMSRIENRVAQIRAMSPADQAKMASSLSPTALIASVSPQALVTAVAALPDVSKVVTVDRPIDPGIAKLTADTENHPDVIPRSDVIMKTS